MVVTFSSTVFQAPGLSATGLPVPNAAVESLGRSRKPAVVVSLGNYSYRSTVAHRYGGYIIPLSAAHRSALGLSAGDEVTVAIELDSEPRTVTLPLSLVTGFDARSGSRAAFDSLSPSRQAAIVALVESAKTEETRLRRVASAVEGLTPA